VGRIVSVTRGNSSARRKSGTDSMESLVRRGAELQEMEEHVELY
jgi:hypothetical protein